MTEQKMTLKQQKFCEYYIQDQNAANAAVKAGYSKKTARGMGAENLTKPYIKEYIDKRLAEELEKTKMTTTEILQELTKIARGDAEAAVDSIVQYNPDGTITKVAKKSVSNKIKALELLGKSQKMFVDKSEVDIKGGPVTINVIPASEAKKNG